ncbi:hypothetical protein ANCCEY_11005 [Ancylostoma ceylanicum]|uniref:Uncharacterized protein n=1 Tax=Ancylostoma ceylanicum TaxID=53326 RepID=A0A0D6LIZ6_9BILA|nr:hypothetical protein ANCCEY_11005 [Ancylostoma ceylanicum]
MITSQVSELTAALHSTAATRPPEQDPRLTMLDDVAYIGGLPEDMDHLDKLVSRLETVTAKLESLGSFKPQPAPKPAHLGGGNEQT